MFYKMKAYLSLNALKFRSLIKLTKTNEKDNINNRRFLRDGEICSLFT